jgi:hypothetical protein
VSATPAEFVAIAPETMMISGHCAADDGVDEHLEERDVTFGGR